MNQASTKVFTPEETVNILHAKSELKKGIEPIEMTIQKLGYPYTAGWFVSGGCIGSLLRGEEPNDYDVYFITEAVADKVVGLFKNDPSYQSMVKQLDEKYRDVVELPDGKWITENATTLNNKIQLITKHYGAECTIRQTFDYVHCMPWYDPLHDTLHISREQYDLNMNKKLKVNNMMVVTQHRQSKFEGRGWTWP